MTDPAFIDPDETLERRNARLLKITEALIRRVERDIDETGNAYSLFQRAVALEGEVRARTQDLQSTLDELNRVNEQLEAANAVADEANRAKTRFLAAASHDVLQPLNAAKLFLGTLQNTNLDDRQRRIAGRVRTAFDSVEALLGALLDISKLDSAGAVAEITTMPITRILDPIATEFAPVAMEKNIGFSVVRCSALIESDPEHLRRVAQNLVSNAVRYCQTGKVLVGCRRRGDTLRIEVHDTGPGIDPDKVPEIFREFHRLDSADSGTEQGMGLGLAIVDRACRLLGHSIGISSMPGKGSMFAVTVPLVQSVTDRGESDRTAMRNHPESLKGMIALGLVEDADTRASLLKSLENWGASVIAVESLESALQACEQLGLPPDIVLIATSAADESCVSQAISKIRNVHGTPVPAVVIAEDTVSTPDLANIANVSVANISQLHRLRALLTWERNRNQRSGLK